MVVKLSYEQLSALRRIESPTISNAIETFQVRPRVAGYVGYDIRCLFPELPPSVGYAVTCTVDSTTEGRQGTGFNTLYARLSEAPKPALVVMQDAGTDRLHSCHAGEIMATTMKRLGAVGILTDGGLRDVKEVRALGSFQYFCAGLVVSHGNPVCAGSELPAIVERESMQGLRVLLFTSFPERVALRNAADTPTLPQGLMPLGLISLSDELRPQARETLRQLGEAGIQFKVISGDNPQTVTALVKQMGLSNDIRAVSGLDLATMDAEHFAATAADATVFGRITPQQKERLVEVLHKQGHYVAMIGDGVNDVLSLKKADLGIAMQSGSQATRSVADIVLLGDSFVSLPSAFREGRRIRNGMQDIFKLFLTRVFYFVVLMVGTAVVGGFPFDPKQSSILVLLTVGLPSFMLAAWAQPRPLEKDARRSLWHFVLPAASTLGVVGLLLYFSHYVLADSQVLFHPVSAAVEARQAQDAQTALTIFATFSGIALILFVEPPTPFWAGGNELRGDTRIFYLVLAMCLASVLLITVPPLRSLFDLVQLDGVDYLLIAVCVVIWLFVVCWVWRARILERFLALDRIY